MRKTIATSVTPRWRFRLDARGDWLCGVRRSLSPNRDARPPGVEPSLLVVHGISLPAGEFGTAQAEALFLNRLDPAAHPSFDTLRGLRVSAHALIDRAGLVVQFVPFSERAWHAGESSYHGRTRCNDFSIGVELEGADHVPYADAQYRSLAAVTLALIDRYPRLGAGAVVGHSDVAPGRKTDPGPAFDWDYMRSLLVHGAGHKASLT